MRVRPAYRMFRSPDVTESDAGSFGVGNPDFLRDTISIGDESYPPLVRLLETPPAVLWAIGNVALGHMTPAVAVVGTRNATAYGERVTKQLVRALVRGGACIVSGMARGIDSFAHRSALDCGGATIAVLGTGADVVYPASNRRLYREIAERGLILSEYAPGTTARKWQFPERNRIIAALARLTIVVEAGVRSGASTTADLAAALGREVAAVPGPLDSPQSAGTNAMIREGVHMIACIDDALTLAGIATGVPLSIAFGSDAERRVWDALADRAPSLDVLCSRVALPARECLEAVTALELSGAVECALTGEVLRRR
jgi:DNA processing protein